MDKVIVKVVGHTNSKLEFYPSSRCGEIKDGVAFAHAGEGGWVISFTDFKKMYHAAIKARHKEPHE
jgi:hypothetical protein